jgi:hypothetical protein
MEKCCKGCCVHTKKKLRWEVDFDDSEACHWFDIKKYVVREGLISMILEAYHWFNQIFVACLVIKVAS